ncbi:MAG: 2-oxoacid:ferredoxin oxidoreductase subunit beta [Chloroflexi bacterium]|nr:2-oxoacid:ferredoxin oxidoreductase subunit beta [Chloroflexota bacterium]
MTSIPLTSTVAPLLNQVKLKPNDYKSEVKPIWCPGCGDFGVLAAFYRALSDLGVSPEKAVIASGIGCSGRFPAFVESYGFHGVHGRALPLATGIKMANPDLMVAAIGGDGDAFSIGAGHLPHAARRNIDLTYIVMDNEIYGLTKGQASPTSPVGLSPKGAPYGEIKAAKSTPYGNSDAPINPIVMALAYGATYIARGFSSKPREMVELIKRGLTHKGFAFIQIYSPCVTFFDTYDHFKEKTAPLPADHNSRDKIAAFKMALDEEHLYLGEFYTEDRPSMAENARAIRERAGSNFSMDSLIERYKG